MNINFAMWKTALWTLVKMDNKDEWDKLDVVSKWLIATRSGVTLVTVYTCVIAGMLAWRDGYFCYLTLAHSYPGFVHRPRHQQPAERLYRFQPWGG